MDTSCLDPRRFKELIDGGIPLSSLNNIAELAGLDATSLYVDTTTDVGIGLLRDAGEQSHHETDKTMEVDSHVMMLSNALEPVSSVSHVVTRFCTDIRFTRLLSPICTLLISSLLTQSVVFTSFL